MTENPHPIRELHVMQPSVSTTSTVRRWPADCGHEVRLNDEALLALRSSAIENYFICWPCYEKGLMTQ